MKPELEQLKTLLQKFDDNPVIYREHELQIIYDFVFNGVFFPMKEKMPGSEHDIKTILYLKDIATENNFTDVSGFDAYYQKKQDWINQLFEDLRKEKDN